MNVKKVFAVLAMVSLMQSATVGSMQAAQRSVWRPIQATCKRGAQVGVSAKGKVTVTWKRFKGESIVRTIDFGNGMSKTVVEGLPAAYEGVGVSGDLIYVSNAKCR